MAYDFKHEEIQYRRLVSCRIVLLFRVRDYGKVTYIHDTLTSQDSLSPFSLSSYPSPFFLSSTYSFRLYYELCPVYMYSFKGYEERSKKKCILTKHVVIFFTYCLFLTLLFQDLKKYKIFTVT